MVRLLRRPLSGLLSVAALSVFAAGNGAAPAMAVASSPGSCAWTVVPSPHGPRTSYLVSVSADSEDDAWAVGVSTHPARTYFTLAEHWDGSTWTVVPTPSPGHKSVFDAVFALSPTDAWAVGTRHDYSVLIAEHWDGTAWTMVPIPTPNGNGVGLHSVWGTSSTDVWAVGFTFVPDEPPYARTLIEHWNGRAWHVVPSPNPGVQDDNLQGVVAISPTDAWAVGHMNQSLNDGETLIEHWDGTAWTVVASPNGEFPFSLLFAVGAVTANDIWAVGVSRDDSIDSLYLHWDGSIWSTVPGPAGMSGDRIYGGLAAIATDRVWAVGAWHGTLAVRWNGRIWKIVTTPNPGSFANALAAASPIPGTNQAWAVGYTSSFGEKEGTLIERSC